MLFVTRWLISGACNSKEQNSKNCVFNFVELCTIYLSFNLSV